MNKNLRNTLVVGGALVATALLVESCPEKERVLVDENPQVDISAGREKINDRIRDLIENNIQAGEALKPTVDVTDEIRECVEDSGDYTCFSNPFGSTKCYSQAGTFPITISGSGMNLDADGNLLESGIRISVGPGAYSEVFESKEGDEACDYAVDLLEEKIGVGDLDSDLYSDQALAYWGNVPSIMPSLGIMNYKLFNEIEDGYDITDMGGDVVSVDFGDWQTVIYSDIAGERDDDLEDMFSVRFHVRNPRGIYKVFDDPHLVLDYLEEGKEFQE